MQTVLGYWTRYVVNPSQWVSNLIMGKEGSVSTGSNSASLTHNQSFHSHNIALVTHTGRSVVENVKCEVRGFEITSKL